MLDIYLAHTRRERFIISREKQRPTSLCKCFIISEIFLAVGRLCVAIASRGIEFVATGETKRTARHSCDGYRNERDSKLESEDERLSAR